MTSLSAPSSTTAQNLKTENAPVEYTMNETKSPEMDLTTLDNKVEKLSDYMSNGKPTVINFWATWCGPCRMEMPHLEKFAEKYNDDVNILAISDEPVKKLQGFANEYNLDDLKLYQGNSAVFGIRSIPQTYVFDTQGQRVYDIVGATTFENDGVEKSVKALLYNKKE